MCMFDDMIRYPRLNLVLTYMFTHPFHPGGPYKKPFATYREFGCIPDDTYAFTIFDSGGQVMDDEDPFASENDASGSYLMGINYDNIRAGSTDLNFGPSKTTWFVID